MDRLARERSDAARYLPANARQVTFGALTGWAYDFENDLTDWYRMWAYYDPRTSLYRVKMVEPAVTRPVNTHRDHYFAVDAQADQFFRDGDLCLTRDVGTRTLREAYARSVAFSIGWSWWQRDGTFPFNLD